jgi:hypothetical protein
VARTNVGRIALLLLLPKQGKYIGAKGDEVSGSRQSKIASGRMGTSARPREEGELHTWKGTRNKRCRMEIARTRNTKKKRKEGKLR